MTVHLFIYGTLKRGQPRHAALSRQTFVAEVRTAPAYRMFNAGTYPALVEAEQGVAVEGELWAVSETCLRELDVIEGVAERLYARRPVLLQSPHDDVVAETYLYLQNIAGFRDCGSRWRGA